MELEERVAELERRVAELEAAGGQGEAAAVTAVPVPDGFWALSTWKEQLAEAGLDGGGVLFTGAVGFPSGKHYEWQVGFSTESLMEGDLARAAETLSALGNPVRLLMLREVLLGRSTVSSLAQVADMGSSGQIYHHLRQMTAAGWLHSSARGHYAVPAERVVPLLVALAVAQR
jgi:DNA-binding transcriptional ArsR family regulator